MPGVTKHIYEHDIRDIISMWNDEIKNISNCLPIDYTEEDIVRQLKRFYPHEWNSVEVKYEYYTKKDTFLKKRLGKTRYNMKSPSKLVTTTPQYRKLMNADNRKRYADAFDEITCDKCAEELWKKRQDKIARIDKKIESAKLKVQEMTPDYIDQLIGLYERKNTSQKDRMYIVAELQKYYSPKIMQFFFKLNDTELNKQLRWIAFYHLQSFNIQPRARRQKYMQVHTKNKKRKEYLKHQYPNEHYNIPKNPDELEYRIENAKEQKIKSYDYFISHSSKDSKAVQKLITFQNKKGKNIFCDWINDADYLKRHLVCEATLKVIEKRLEQSKAVIFVESDNSLESVWCKYELNYFEQFNRSILVIKKEDLLEEKMDLLQIIDKWYLDSNYKEYVLM